MKPPLQGMPPSFGGMQIIYSEHVPIGQMYFVAADPADPGGAVVLLVAKGIEIPRLRWWVRLYRWAFPRWW